MHNSLLKSDHTDYDHAIYEPFWWIWTIVEDGASLIDYWSIFPHNWLQKCCNLLWSRYLLYNQLTMVQIDWASIFKIYAQTKMFLKIDEVWKYILVCDTTLVFWERAHTQTHTYTHTQFYLIDPIKINKQ